MEPSASPSRVLKHLRCAELTGSIEVSSQVATLPCYVVAHSKKELPPGPSAWTAPPRAAVREFLCGRISAPRATQTRRAASLTHRPPQRARRLSHLNRFAPRRSIAMNASDRSATSLHEPNPHRDPLRDVAASRAEHDTAQRKRMRLTQYTAVHCPS